jgi:hypothetical protein
MRQYASQGRNSQRTRNIPRVFQEARRVAMHKIPFSRFPVLQDPDANEFARLLLGIDGGNELSGFFAEYSKTGVDRTIN